MNTAWDIHANSSLYDADRATNDVKLSMVGLYNNALVPVLRVFGDLPPKIQQFTVGLLGASVASQLLGGIGIGSILKGVVLLIPRLIIMAGALHIMIGKMAVDTVLGSRGRFAASGGRLCSCGAVRRGRW